MYAYTEWVTGVTIHELPRMTVIKAYLNLGTV